MPGRRVAILVAIMAALAGAPSSVLAATPNELSQASVTPSSGGPSTLFVVSVRYQSVAGYPATAVSASAGGVPVAMLTLISGTATDGVWRATTTLPPGTWDVTLQAVVAKGPQPTVSAGVVTVGGATAAPSGTGGSLPSSAAEQGSGSGLPASPVAQPVATPVPHGTSSQAPSRSSTAAVPSRPPTGMTSHGTASVAGREAKPAHTARPAPTGSMDPALRSPATTSTGTAAAPATVRDDRDLGLLMLMGTLAVGLVALVGWAWVIVAGRRERRAALASVEPAPTDPGVIAAAIVEQRALRRARLRSADDPIVAAMGLPDQESTPAAEAQSRGASPRKGGGRSPTS